MLRVGKRYLNEDRITNVVMTETGTVVVFFGDDDYLNFSKAEALALLRWLDNVSVHLDADSGEEKDYADYRDRGGEMPKDEWRLLSAELAGLREKLAAGRGSPSGLFESPPEALRLRSLESLLLL